MSYEYVSNRPVCHLFVCHLFVCHLFVRHLFVRKRRFKAVLISGVF